MFDLDAGKLIIVGIAALVFIPSKDLPRVLRQAGQFVGKMKRMANDFQGQFMDAMREADMADLRREAQKLAESARVDTGLSTHAREIEQHLAMPLAARPVEPASAAVAPHLPDQPARGGDQPAYGVMQPLHVMAEHEAPSQAGIGAVPPPSPVVPQNSKQDDNAPARV